MTKTQFKKRTRALKKEVLKIIDSRIDKFLESNAVDLGSYEDNYLLSKIFMHACAHEIAFQFEPLTKSSLKTANKIKLFL